MVSEPKAHVTKGKAVKKQKEKGGVDQQVMANQPLLTYYMNSLVGVAGVQNPPPASKRSRVEDANGDTNDTEMWVTSDVTLAFITHFFLCED